MKFWGKWKKRAQKRVWKRATVNTLGWVSLFPSFFASILPLFLYFMPSGCSYRSSKDIYHFKCSKRTGVIFSGFYSTLFAKHEKRCKKSAKKGAKRVQKGQLWITLISTWFRISSSFTERSICINGSGRHSPRFGASLSPHRQAGDSNFSERGFLQTAKTCVETQIARPFPVKFIQSNDMICSLDNCL
jgi:hypothetical protein